MNNKNINSKKAEVGQNDLTEKQSALLVAIATASENLADNHVDRGPIKPFSPDVFNALKRKELANSKGKYVWVSKAGLKVAVAKMTELEKIDAGVTDVDGGAIEKPVKKAPRVKKEGGPTLDWAFRRLRRQAVFFFGGDDADKKKALREKLDLITGGYMNLAKEFGGYDSRTWVDFMESFFAHEIHPGARSK